jgi:hypothetical protein
MRDGKPRESIRASANQPNVEANACYSSGGGLAKGFGAVLRQAASSARRKAPSSTAPPARSDNPR